MKKFLMMALVFACSVIGANAQKRNVDFSVKAGIGMSSWLGWMPTTRTAASLIAWDLA